MTRLFFSNTANQLSLSAGVVASDTVLVFSTTATGWPSSPCKAVIDPDTDLAEVVLVTVINPSTFQVVRGQDGTTAQNHGAGAFVEHRWSAAQADEANLHANLDGGVHGITGDVVGTDDVQTLENKTITSPLINTETVQTSDTSPASSMKAGTNGVNIQEWQDASGVRLSRVGAHGEVEVNVNDPAAVALLLKLAASQTADGIELQTSAGAILLKVDSKGRLVLDPSDLTTPAIRVIPPADTALPGLNFRNAANSSDTFVLTTLGEITNALKAWLRGDGSSDPLRFPLDGSKFKVDNSGNLTVAGTVTASGNVSAPNVVTKVAYASSGAAGTATASEIKDDDVGDVTFTAIAGHKYRIVYHGRCESATGTNSIDLRLRDGGASSPTTGSTQIQAASVGTIANTGADFREGRVEITKTFSAGTHKIAAFIVQTSGSGTVRVGAAGGEIRELTVYDEGTV